MGQILTKSRATVLILLVAGALNLYLYFVIRRHLNEPLNTEASLCMEWMAFVTEGAAGLLWYTYKKHKL